jgi:hypothetical protein
MFSDRGTSMWVTGAGDSHLLRRYLAVNDLPAPFYLETVGLPDLTCRGRADLARSRKVNQAIPRPHS